MSEKMADSVFTSVISYLPPTMKKELQKRWFRKKAKYMKP